MRNLLTPTILSALTVLLSVTTVTDGVRCYECRSDQQANCGDPFFEGNIRSKNCDETFTTSATSTMCFKVSQQVRGGQYVTIRGCAPFDSLTFSEPMQRAMRGTYWRGFYSSFSLCDFNSCNGATPLSNPAAMLGSIVFLIISVSASLSGTLLRIFVS